MQPTKSTYFSLDDRPDDLADVLKLLLKELVDKGLLKGVSNPDELIKDTIANIKEGLGGNDIKREDLNNPAMKLKLATSLIATLTLGKGQDKFNFEALFQPNNPVMLEKELSKMMAKYFLLQPEGAKAFVALTNNMPKPNPSDTLEPPTPKPEGGAQKPAEEEKSTFAAIYADDGTLIDILEGVNVSAKDVGKSVISLSEMLSSDLMPDMIERLEDNNFIKDVQHGFESAALNSTAPRPTPGGH